MQGITFHCIPRAQLSSPHFLPFLNNYQSGSFQAFCYGNKRHILFTVPVISYCSSTWMDWESRRLSSISNTPQDISSQRFQALHVPILILQHPGGCSHLGAAQAPLHFLSTAGHQLFQNPSVYHRQNPLSSKVPSPEAANTSLPFPLHLWESWSSPKPPSELLNFPFLCPRVKRI